MKTKEKLKNILEQIKQDALIEFKNIELIPTHNNPETAVVVINLLGIKAKYLPVDLKIKILEFYASKLKHLNLNDSKDLVDYNWVNRKAIVNQIFNVVKVMPEAYINEAFDLLKTQIEIEKSEEVKSDAIIAIGNIAQILTKEKQSEAFEVIKSLLSNKNDVIRQAAISAMFAMTQHLSITQLFEFNVQNSDLDVRKGALDAFSFIKGVFNKLSFSDLNLYKNSEAKFKAYKREIKKIITIIDKLPLEKRIEAFEMVKTVNKSFKRLNYPKNFDKQLTEIAKFINN